MKRIVVIIFLTLFASPVIAQDSIELVYNVQHPGGDYTSFQAINAEECAHKCEISSRCQAFDYHKSDSSCWLKDMVYQSRAYQGVVSGIKRRQSNVTTGHSIQLQSVQRALTEQGYNPGVVDGMMGQKTRKALRKYQRDYDVPVTGRVDEATLTSLGINQSSQTPRSPVNIQNVNQFPPKPTSEVSPGSRDNIVNVALFPWVLNGDSSSFVSILKENINYRIEESNTFRLKTSYYKMKGIPKLNIGDSSYFYSLDKPNISVVQQIGREHGIDVAVLGTMDIHCRLSDNCQVKQMEIMLIDTNTGVITTAQGSAWDQDARDVINSNVSKVFSTLENTMNSH